MATGTGNLPYPGKVYVPFDILTAQELNEDVANIESLATGTGIGDGALDGSVVLQDDSVEVDKIDLASFGTTSVTTGTNLSNASSGTTAVTTNFSFVNTRTYLILFQSQQSSGDGSVWYQELRINGTAVSTSRFGGSTNTQMSAPIHYVHVAASTSTVAVTVVTIRASGTGTVNVEIPRLSIIPLIN